MEVFAVVFFGILGSVLGSFSVAQVWRIRALQLNEEGDFSKKEWKNLQHLIDDKKSKQRSHCLKCGYFLRWFDLIPVFSWLVLRGRCRNCGKKIGKTEFLAELISGIFLASFFAMQVSSVGYFRMFIFALLASPLIILFVYDMKWSLLPIKIMWIFNFLAMIYYFSGDFNFGVDGFLNLLISFAVFPFLYFLLTKISKGAWVGDGDWILAIGLIFLLPKNPIFSLVAVFLSNIFGLIFILLSNVVLRKKNRQIPFGPAMISACLTIVIFQNFFDFLIVNFY